MDLPPIPDDEMKALKDELRMCRKSFRDDAIQEAWVAHLSGESPIAAVRTFKTREQKALKRLAPQESEDAIDPVEEMAREALRRSTAV